MTFLFFAFLMKIKTKLEIVTYFTAFISKYKEIQINKNKEIMANKHSLRLQLKL